MRENAGGICDPCCTLRLVDSSNVRLLGYDARQERLVVVFKGNSVYQYMGISPLVFLKLAAAESAGAALDESVKKSGYEYERLA